MRPWIAAWFAVVGCADGSAGGEQNCTDGELPPTPTGGETSTEPLATFPQATPVVLWTSPALGDHEVDPATHEIRAVFSQPMKKAQYAFVQVNDLFPGGEGDVTWLDDRTVSMPVSLEPNHTYEVWLNDPYTDEFDAFMSTGGEFAGPFGLVFRTGDAR